MLAALPGPDVGREAQPGPTGEAVAPGEVMSVGDGMSVGEVMSVGDGMSVGAGAGRGRGRNSWWPPGQPGLLPG
ncbi:hypothetical protein ACFQX6_14620 [Streptosporangium lutulentum]